MRATSVILTLALALNSWVFAAPLPQSNGTSTSTGPTAPKIPGLPQIPGFPQTPGSESKTDANGCAAVELISARGTTEPQSGSFVMRPAIQQIMRQIGASVYDVVYPADMNFGTGPLIGSKDAIKHLKEQSTRCPNAKFVLMGYSQGAMVATTAMKTISSSEKSLFDKITAVIMFGNPSFDPRSEQAAGTAKGQAGIPAFPGQGLPKEWVPKVKDFCNTGDPVCKAGNLIQVHASYGISPQSKEAAEFIVSKIKGN